MVEGQYLVETHNITFYFPQPTSRWLSPGVLSLSWRSVFDCERKRKRGSVCVCFSSRPNVLNQGDQIYYYTSVSVFPPCVSMREYFSKCPDPGKPSDASPSSLTPSIDFPRHEHRHLTEEWEFRSRKHFKGAIFTQTSHHRHYQFYFIADFRNGVLYSVLCVRNYQDVCVYVYVCVCVCKPLWRLKIFLLSHRKAQGIAVTEERK